MSQSWKLKIEPAIYKCDICKDKGFLLNDKGQYIGKCECQIKKESLMTLKRSKLDRYLKIYTFENYIVENDWQRDYKQRAMKFVNNPKGWFTFLAQAGLGKSHLMTAMTIHLIGKGKDAEYIKWQDEMLRSKNNYWNFDERLLNRLKTVEVLYIDDFLKTDNGNNVHSEEKRLAFNIIDSRYNNPDLITIISSEKSLIELNKIDSALTGRIVEMSGGSKSPNLINSSVKEDGNYRLR